MTYLVNEIFYSVQGEGYWSGRPAVFVRFSNCNLWTGKEDDRDSAICQFCDTTFTEVRHTFDTPRGLALAVVAEAGPADMVILTGGEPALQIDEELVRALHVEGFYVAIETNGTRSIPENLDWVCVSPKTPKLRVTRGDELKLVYPQTNVNPDMFRGLKRVREWGVEGFDHFWLSPMNGINELDEANTKAAYDYCLLHPQWRLNTQTHKVIGVR